MLQFLYIYLHILYVCIELCVESHLRTTVYKCTLDWILHFSILRYTYVFYTPVYSVFIKVLVKSHGRFGVLQYNTFCFLTHIF